MSKRSLHIETAAACDFFLIVCVCVSIEGPFDTLRNFYYLWTHAFAIFSRSEMNLGQI